MRVGAYEVTGELGRGGSAVVHAGRAPDGTPVAIKLLAGGSQPQEARFQRELEALRRLRHPGIVGFVDAGVHQGRPFLVTELVQGETLQARLDRTGALSPDHTIELGVELADAEEALQRGDAARARTLAEALVEEEAAPGQTRPFDEGGASFLDLLRDALARTEGR